MSALRRIFHRYADVRGIKPKRYSKVKKLKEETHELVDAIKDHKKSMTMNTKTRVMEETADVVWCLTAISEKYGFTIDEALDLKTARDVGRNKN